MSAFWSRLIGSNRRRQGSRNTRGTWLLVLCGLLAAGALVAPVPAQGTPEVKGVEIWAVRDPQEASAIALASELGYYKAEGLDVTLKWIVSGPDMPNLVASGQVNFYGESALITAILRDKGIDIRYVLPLADIGGTQAFVLGPKVTLKSPKELEGKRIGMAAGSGVEIAIANMCKQYGVDFKKLIFVNLQPPDQAPALARGDIDAMAVWQPWVLAGIKLGGKLYFTGNRSYINGTGEKVAWMYLDSGLNVRGDFLRKNPETVKAVMRALIRATDYINRNPAEKVAAVLSKPLNVDRTDLVTMLKQNIYSNDVTQRVLDGTRELLEWGATRKYTSRVFDRKDVFDFTLLKEIAPERVKVTGF